MTRWDYGFEIIDLADKQRFKDWKWLPNETINQRLQAWGDEGWELVSVVPTSTWHSGQVGEEMTITVTAYFKRPRN